MKKNSTYLKKTSAWWTFAFCVSILGMLWLTSVPGNTPNAPSDNFRHGESLSFYAEGQTGTADTVRFRRGEATIDYSGITFTPWDVKAASAGVKPRASKPYTIMISMDGSDLESESGAATNDLVEMLNSGVSSKNANIVIFTGGANRWRNNIISPNNCSLLEVADGAIHKIANVGLRNMGNPGTLSSFIDFTLENFPAEKYGLIMWDHGGGSIAGYGHDEKFINGNLTLLDMNYAFEKSKLRSQKLEFLGFDSCLMSSVEMAVVASEYANYLIASEDLIPGDGWDYSFLSTLNQNPRMDGLNLGIKITDYFMRYYRQYSELDLNLSVVDLSGANRVMDSMGNLMSLCSQSLQKNMSTSFRTLSQKRNNTKTFGVGSPRDNECDMIDIGDMARRLHDIYPNESAKLLNDLNACVVYNNNNSGQSLSGLSTYYIYGGKNYGQESLGVYASLAMDDEYTGYLNRFFSILKSTGTSSGGTSLRSRSSGNASTSEDIIGSDLTVWSPVPDKEGYYIMTGIKYNVDSENVTSAANAPWPVISGKNVCLYEISRSAGRSLYAVPAAVNDKDCDVIVLISDEHPEGKILGVRNQDGYIIQKGYDQLESGDKLGFYYQEKYFGTDVNKKDDEDFPRFKSGEITVNGDLKLEWSKLGDDAHCSLRLTDIRNDETFEPLKRVA